MKLTSEQRQAMVGKRYIRHQSRSSSYVTVRAIERNAGGYTVKFTGACGYGLTYCGLQKFLKRYKHELMEVGE